MDDRLARITLACIAEPGSSVVAASVAEHGPQAALTAVLAERAPAGPRSAGQLSADQVPAMLARMHQQGVRVIVPGDPEFPSQLLDLPEPPLALWVRGPLDLRAAAVRSVAVVGARACTAYGERATAQLAGGLAESGWAVVSGGAFGIDAAAHRVALAVEGPTVAVLACGVDVAYPRAHDALLCRIADAGSIVSELPPGSPPLKHRFLARNRLIAALTRGTVVVEAARRSGAIATANRALELGRVVMAVPGPVTSVASSGTNRLLHEQTARAVADHDEVVSLLVGTGVQDWDVGPNPGDGPIGPGVAGDPQLGLPTAGDAGAADLPPEAAGVHRVLPARGGHSVEQLARLAGLTPAHCLAQLGLLELVGLARRTRGGWCRSR